MILIHVEDEVLAWVIFMKVLTRDEWRRLFLFQTPKLFELTREVRQFITTTLPSLSNVLKKYNVILESLFASAFMTLFSNLVSIENATRILDRFILSKEFTNY